MWWVFPIELLCDPNYNEPYFGPFDEFDMALHWHQHNLPATDLWVVAQWSDNDCYVYDNTGHGIYIGAFMEDGTVKEWSSK